MNISRPFIQRPVMTTLIMLSCFLAGLLAFYKLPVSDIPEIHHPVITIQTAYPGANAEMVFQQVTDVLEKELTRVKGISELSSQTFHGFSSITLRFPFDKNMHQAQTDVQAVIHQSIDILPKGIDSQPRLIIREDSQSPILCLQLSSNLIPKEELRYLADSYVIPRLNRIEGVANVVTYGPSKSIRIHLNPELMAARKIAFNDVVEAIQQKTQEISLGSIQTENKRLNIELTGSLKRAKELEKLPIGPSGLHLNEIGKVLEEDSGDKECHLVTPEKIAPMVFMMIQKGHEGNTVQISQAIKEAITSLQKELPSTVHLGIWFDKAVWIQESIHDVEWSFLFASLLVFFVIYMSLGRVSVAFIPSMALPFSLIGTFAIMYLLNFSLDLLSLLALTLSVGFVVDDAIVVLENIVRLREKGMPAKEASLLGSKQIGFTILSMTLSLVAVFIPILFMPGMYGLFFREFSITLAVAIIISGVISLTLTPLLCSRMGHHAKTPIHNHAMTNAYAKSLKFVFRYPKTVLAITCSCLLITIPLFMRLQVTLIPPEDRGILFAAVTFSSPLTESQANSYQKEAELLIQKNKAIESVCSSQSNNYLLFFIRLLPLTQRAAQTEVVNQLTEALDTIVGAKTYMHPYQLINLDFDFSKPGNFRLLVKDTHFEEVEAASKKLFTALENDPDIGYAYNSCANESSRLVVEVNELQAKKLGISKQKIQDLLHFAYGKSLVGSLQNGTNREDITIQLQPEYAKTSTSLDTLFLSSSDDTLVPLKALATWKESTTVSSYELHDRMPVAYLSFSFQNDISAIDGLKKVEKIAAETLPNSVSSRFSGSAVEIQNGSRNSLLLLLAATIVMYIVLGILYESFIHPIVILSSIPFAGLGGVLTLYLFNEPITIFSAVGFLLLIGIVKKNGIMLVDYAVDAQREGKNSDEAILEASIVRFRPIMMTTCAAIMGAIPLAMGYGDTANIRQGLGLVIVGGLLFSQLLTLYVTPLLYLGIENLKKREPHGEPILI